MLRAQQAGGGFSSFVHAQHQGPLAVTGEKFVYDYKTDSFLVTGDAIVTQANSVLSADQVDLQRRQHTAHAVGNVQIVDPLGRITASEAQLNLTDETGELTNGKVTNKDKSYRLEGKKIRKLEGQRYSVTDGFFTTCGCDPGTPDWSITAKSLDVHIGGEGKAHHAHFNILGYPVIPLPYIAFPANTERHSGFLAPRVGESGLRGLQLLQPYYIDINKSSGATVALDVQTSQRVGALGEYRLVSGIDDYLVLDGSFYDEHLRTPHSRVHDVIDDQIADPHIPMDRYGIIAMARQHLTNDITAYGDTVSVSDSLFLREMNVWTLSRGLGTGIAFPNSFQSMRDAVSHFGLLDSYSDGFARLQSTWHQDLIQPQQFALQTLPEILVSGRKDLLGGLAHADYDVQGTNFWRANGVNGLRLDLNPRVTVPWRLGDYLYGFGTLGLRETVYDTSGHQIAIIPIDTKGRKFNNGLALGALGQGGLQSREIVYANTGVASEIEKVYDVDWKYIEKLKHTIEPFVTYSYVPRIGQSDFPLFDEVDRVEPRSLIVYGFTSRLYAKLPQLTAAQSDVPNADGQEVSTISPFRARTLFDGGRVEELVRFNLMQAYDTTNAIAKGGSRFSDLQAGATLFPTRLMSFGSQIGYDPRQSQIRYASAYLNFQPWWTNNQSKLYMGKAATGSFLQVGYNYIAPGPTFAKGINANFSQSLVLRAYYDLFDRLGVYFAPSYDFATRRMLSQEYGVRVKSPCDCWATDMGVTKSINPSEVAFQFQVTLGGIGSVGESPFGRNPFQSHTGILSDYR